MVVQLNNHRVNNQGLLGVVLCNRVFKFIDRYVLYSKKHNIPLKCAENISMFIF